MIKDECISFIGGDLRLVYLAKLYEKEGKIIFTFGMENAKEICNENKNIFFLNNLDEVLKKSNIIIAPIPFTKDKKEINTPLSKEKINIKEIISKIPNKTLIAGNIPQEYTNFNNFKIIDIMKNEELTVFNTIATAEGTIKIIIENTNKIIHKSKILILGFGRVAKTLAFKLNGLNANITCAARKDSDFAWISTYGFNSININNLEKKLSNYDVIINTVPYQILTKKELNYIKKESLLIDLASAPGGINKKESKELGLKYIWALALPGKVAPYSTAEFIKKII